MAHAKKVCKVPYLLDEMLLLIVATPTDVLNELVAALEYQPRLIFK